MARANIDESSQLTYYWLGCLLPLVVGNLLMLVPDRHIEAMRSVQRDVVAPGEKVLKATADYSTSRFTSLIASEQASQAALSDSAVLASYVDSLSANADLRAELNQVQSQLQYYQQIQATAPLEQSKLLQARVLGREGVLAQSLKYILGSGSSQKIEADQLVIWEHDWTLDLGKDHQLLGDELIRKGHVLLGRVKSVGQTTSVMQPVTSSTFRTIARIVRPNGQATTSDVGSLSGTGGPTCRLQYISASTPVSEGDLVVTEAQTPAQTNYIGKITKAEILPGQVDWEITVTPASLGIVPKEVLVVQHSQTRIP
ncbi:rod shape-determining protein MreC [Lacunimicrobium album]